MLPNVSELRLENNAARKPVPTKDNLVPLSVLDEPMTFQNLKDWGNITSRKAYEWLQAQSADQSQCIYTTDSLAHGCDPDDTETWNRLFWVAVMDKISIPYAAQISNSVAPEPAWASMQKALPIPKPWVDNMPTAIIQVTPSTQEVPGAIFVHKATLLKMFAIQRQKQPDGVVVYECGKEEEISYPDAYHGPGYGKPDFFIPRPNGTNERARVEMRAILHAFLLECDSYRTMIEINAPTWVGAQAVKLYEVGCDDNRKKFDVRDGEGVLRQSNPFSTPWTYGTGTNAVHYMDFGYPRGTQSPLTTKFSYVVAELSRPRTPIRNGGEEDLIAYEDLLQLSDQEEEEEEEDEEDEEEEDSDPSTGGEGRAMTAAIEDANNLDSATFSTNMSSGTRRIMPIVNLITFRIASFDSEYLEALSDPDLAQPAFLRGLKRLWEGFHILSIFDAIKVLALLNNAQKKLGRLVTFEIRQLVTSDLRRLKSWVRFNLPGVPDEDPRMLPARGLLHLADIYFDYLTDPMVDVEAFSNAVEKMESASLDTEVWSRLYRDVAAVMRRIVLFAARSYDYLQRVVLIGEPEGNGPEFTVSDGLLIRSGAPPLSHTVLRLVRNLVWDDLNDEWDVDRVKEYMQLPLINFLDTMTLLTRNSPRGFMDSLRQDKVAIINRLETFLQEYGSSEPQLVDMIQRVVERLRAAPPSLASQQRQSSVPAVQGAETLRNISNTTSPERDSSDTEPPTPNPERSLMRTRSGSGEETPSRRRQRTGATLRRAGLLPRFF
jgi:hypothetical protein